MADYNSISPGIGVQNTGGGIYITESKPITVNNAFDCLWRYRLINQMILPGLITEI